jgi:hypothetical protein
MGEKYQEGNSSGHPGPGSSKPTAIGSQDHTYKDAKSKKQDRYFVLEADSHRDSN